ncbi:MAG: RNA 2',3'-cyclic phosphodiesterase [Candidatus Hodarchaeota archaeon]
MEKIRAFVSIDIKDPQLLDRIASIQEEIRHSGADVKHVERQNIHFTLKFLGNVSPSVIDPIFEVMQRVSFRPFELEVNDVGCFNPRRPRVIWLGAGEGAEEVVRIQTGLEKGLTELDFKPERRRYTPHATIGRVRSGRNREQLLKTLERLANAKVGVMKVDGICLKKSTLTPKGAIHEVLREARP